ncbi:MAG: DUF3105 domain-containing protein, partial [Alphaproteobacteria bacterium]|nr:DUF3105 domain-containing protein [Alphaproteobacteria bacterium]
MAKSRKKSKQAGAAPRQSWYKLKPWELTVIGGAVILSTWLAWQWQQNKDVEAAFFDLARSGEGALARVEAGRNAGGGHIAPGQSTRYPDQFPTSGPHDQTWVDPGVYDTVQPSTKLVHSIEHGMVVIYYDAPPSEALTMLKDWAGLYRDRWSGVVLTRAPGIGEAFVLTAWNRT